MGARSILGDPRSAQMQSVMNLKIKFRDGFRPFAPSVLKSHVHEWFQMHPGEESPYMLLSCRWPLAGCGSKRARNRMESAHGCVGCGARSPLLPTSITAPASRPSTNATGGSSDCSERSTDKTGCPCMVNTSFNLSWEPIVLQPSEAYHAFMQSEMDALVLEDFLLLKAEQPLGMRLGRDRRID